MSFRRAARTDDNQTDVVKLFRKLGWYVLIISQLKNCCDIIVSKGNVTIAIEIKDGSKTPSQRKLSAGELKFKDEWLGLYELVECDFDVILINKRYNQSPTRQPENNMPKAKDVDTKTTKSKTPTKKK